MTDVSVSDQARCRTGRRDVDRAARVDVKTAQERAIRRTGCRKLNRTWSARCSARRSTLPSLPTRRIAFDSVCRRASGTGGEAIQVADRRPEAIAGRATAAFQRQHLHQLHWTSVVGREVQMPSGPSRADSCWRDRRVALIRTTSPPMPGSRAAESVVVGIEGLQWKPGRECESGRHACRVSRCRKPCRRNRPARRSTTMPDPGARRETRKQGRSASASILKTRRMLCISDHLVVYAASPAMPQSARVSSWIMAPSRTLTQRSGASAASLSLLGSQVQSPRGLSNHAGVSVRRRGG